MFKSKRISLLTIFALILPSAAVATFSASSAMAASSQLAVFQVNGQDVTDGSTVNLDPNTTSVAVTATPVDETATVSVVGDSNLGVGSNDLTVTVTSTDETSAVYSVTLNVLPSTDTGALIYVNGVNRVDGEDVYVAYGTYGVTVEVVTSDVNSSYFVDGDLGLETGDNDLVVTVTAADGVTSQEYHINVNVHQNTDTSVNFISVNGNVVDDGSSVDLVPYTTDVEIAVDTVDTSASFEIDGGTELVPGDNQLIVTVTAADGETQQQYFINLYVPLAEDTTLSSLTVNGVEVVDGEVVDLPAYTTSADIMALANDENAVVEISGGQDLEAGQNVVTVTITAQSGDSATYTITLNVLLSDNVDLSTFKVNGVDVFAMTDNEIGRAHV